MAKIYETQEDVERERLSDTARVERDGQNTLLYNGIYSAALGNTLLRARQAEDTINKLLRNKPTGFTAALNGIEKPLGWGAMAIGAISFATSFFSRNKAAAAEAALEKMGPQQVILPGDVQAGDSIPVSGAAAFRVRKFAAQPEPKSPLEHAGRSCDAPSEPGR